MFPPIYALSFYCPLSIAKCWKLDSVVRSYNTKALNVFRHLKNIIHISIIDHTFKLLSNTEARVLSKYN